MTPAPSRGEVPSEDYVVAPKAVYELAADRYVQFVGTEISAATETATDQSLLELFADLVKQGSVSPVADLGCGPGRVAAFMAARGLDVIGVDVSGSMIAAARAAHRHIVFEVGQLDALPIRSGKLAGAVCWYSIIYTPPEHLEEAFAELARVVLLGGPVLLAFQAGNGDGSHREQAHGTHLSLNLYRHDVREVSRRLDEAGLEVSTTRVREPELDHETDPQAFVFSRRR